MIRLREKGFTLVEIMIVVAIIAILAAIAIPNFMTARSKSRANACKANLRQIESAVEQWAMDNTKTDGDSCTMNNLVTTYIKKEPTCASGGTYGDSSDYTLAGGAASRTYTAGNTNWDKIFAVGGTPWCSIGNSAAAGGYPHVQYP